MPRILIATPLFFALACADKADTPDAAECDAIDLGTQPVDRLPVGEALWLPSSAGTDCPELEWSASEMGSTEGLLLSGEDPAFVALAEGTAELTESTTGTTIAVTSMAASDIPFHNLMYQPSRSMTAVGDEVWVAEAYAPRVARIDAETGEVVGSIPVGPWPVSMASAPTAGVAVVAHAGNDTIGLIDLEEGRLVDVIWIGDEPVTVAVDDATSTAYVALETEHAVAVVDLNERTVTGRYDTPPSPRAIALSDDGSILVVAGHRTGQPDRHPYAEDEVDPIDMTAIDAETGEVLWSVPEVGNIITDAWIDDETSTVWVTATVSHPERGLVTLDSPPFEAQVQEYDLDDGEWLRSTVLQPAAEGEGFVLGPQAIAVDADTVWVAAQDSELVIGLNAETMEETSRTAVSGGPRALLMLNGDAWVHSAQSMTAHRLSSGEIAASVATGVDPRPANVVAGQLHYIQPGDSYGQNFSCNSCHYDGRGDTQVWRAGPFETWELSRPMMWLEGTTPLGWGGYVNDTRTFGYTGFASIIAKWPTTDMAEELGAFLASLAPPPKANAHTQRDGQLSDAGQAGKALFDGKAGCIGCHAGALTSSNHTFEDGITEGRVSTPILVGAYRHNAWLKDGSAHTLREATVAAAEWSGTTDLSDDEVDSVVRYLEELTDRDFFMLRHDPDPTRSLIGVNEGISVTFNQPVWTDDANLDRFSMQNASGESVDFTLSTDARTVHLTPLAPLAPNTAYTVTVDAGLESFDQRTTAEPIGFTVTTADRPDLTFDGRYVLTVDMPAFDFENDRFNPDVTLPAPNPFAAVPNDSGATLMLELKDGLTWETRAVIEGSSFEIAPIPVKAGNALAQASAVVATGEDNDDDGIIDYATGSFIISGPGFFEEDVTWTIEPEAAPSDCTPGAEGDVEVTVTMDGDDIVIDYGDAGALGLYVTTYGATLPFGPGSTVADGDAFWAIATEVFPTGFAGPVTYGDLPEGATDDSEANGAPAGGAELIEGECYQFSVISDAFQIGSFTLEL